MDPELKTQWLAALRSGKYAQGRMRLKSATGYCCLGVLCDLINPKGWTRAEDGEWQWEYDGSSYDGNLYAAALDERLGITDECDNLPPLNDDGQHNFNQIADLIESGRF